MAENFVASINSIVTNNGGTVRVTTAQKVMNVRGTATDFADVLRGAGFKVEKNNLDRNALTIFGTATEIETKVEVEPEAEPEPMLDDATLDKLCDQVVTYLRYSRMWTFDNRLITGNSNLNATQANQIIDRLKEQGKIITAGLRDNGNYKLSDFTRLWKPVAEGTAADFDYKLMDSIMTLVERKAQYRGLTLEQLAEKFVTDDCDARKARVNIRLAIANGWIVVLRDGTIYKPHTSECAERREELALEAGIPLFWTYSDEARSFLGKKATDFQIKYLTEILEYSLKPVDENEMAEHGDEINQLIKDGVIEEQEMGNLHILTLPLVILQVVEQCPHRDFDNLFYMIKCQYVYKNPFTRQDFRRTIDALERAGKLTRETIDDVEFGHKFDFYDVTAKVFGPESKLNSKANAAEPEPEPEAEVEATVEPESEPAPEPEPAAETEAESKPIDHAPVEWDGDESKVVDAMLTPLLGAEKSLSTFEIAKAMGVTHDGGFRAALRDLTSTGKIINVGSNAKADYYKLPAVTLREGKIEVLTKLPSDVMHSIAMPNRFWDILFGSNADPRDAEILSDLMSATTLGEGLTRPEIIKTHASKGSTFTPAAAAESIERLIKRGALIERGGKIYSAWIYLNDD